MKRLILFLLALPALGLISPTVHACPPAVGASFMQRSVFVANADPGVGVLPYGDPGCGVAATLPAFSGFHSTSFASGYATPFVGGIGFHDVGFGGFRGIGFRGAGFGGVGFGRHLNVRVGGVGHAGFRGRSVTHFRGRF